MNRKNLCNSWKSFAMMKNNDKSPQELSEFRWGSGGVPVDLNYSTTTHISPLGDVEVWSSGGTRFRLPDR